MSRLTASPLTVLPTFQPHPAPHGGPRGEIAALHTTHPASRHAE